MKAPTYRRAYRKHFNAMADGLRAAKARPFTVKAVSQALAQGNLNQWFDAERFAARALGRPFVARRAAGEPLPYRGGPLGLMLIKAKRRAALMRAHVWGPSVC